MRAEPRIQTSKKWNSFAIIFYEKMVYATHIYIQIQGYVFLGFYNKFESDRVIIIFEIWFPEPNGGKNQLLSTSIIRFIDTVINIMNRLDTQYYEFQLYHIMNWLDTQRYIQNHTIVRFMQFRLH